MEALLLVVENSGPPMFTRIGVMRALNRHVEHVFRPVAQETPEAGPLSVTEARARWSRGVPEL
jgi:hypothetical protein